MESSGQYRDRPAASITAIATMAQVNAKSQAFRSDPALRFIFFAMTFTALLSFERLFKGAQALRCPLATNSAFCTDGVKASPIKMQLGNAEAESAIDTETTPSTSRVYVK
jgi:hypothetical protein